MAEKPTESVPRTQDDPSERAVLAEMRFCEPYTVGDLVDLFDDASRWTIQRRLDSLVDAGEIEKKKHAQNRVSYYRQPFDGNSAPDGSV